MKHSTTTAVCTVMAAFWIASPVQAQNREHQQMAAELRILQEQAQQLTLALAQVTEALKTVNARLDATDRSIQKAFADQKLVLDNAAKDLDVVRQGTQDTNSRSFAALSRTSF